LETGAQSPDFTLPNQDDEEVTLSSLRGRPVVLYFYPKADTPGCTTQACSVRDHSDAYAAHDAVVLGISPDPVEEVKAFHDKHAMNFTLLADADHAVAEQYGTWVEKSRDGRTSMGNARATFVIAPDGTVAHVFPEVSPKTHDEVVLAALDELAAAA
ncbi:MAG: thioredoxin-dependent thiol peroxidase, partial [Actinomycetota bacterium]|nr:thioredoxin-dependent thiol peroxidase [Actinomycetota bacterium]